MIYAVLCMHATTGVPVPSAPKSLADKWMTDENAIGYLEERGFVLTPHSEWIVPKDHHIEDDEYSALSYLIQEWDYGGIEWRNDE